MEGMVKMQNFYKNKKVLVTGHTGFKGSWLTYILYLFGADVTGIGLNSNTNPSMFSILNLDKKINSKIIDIRNIKEVDKIFKEVEPEIVIHMAAQPLVIDSYENPVYTYDVNVMGTVNVCECIRNSKSVKSFINVTTDKVYENKEWCYGYRENDRLNGYDPYSNSKSCSELVTESYKKSFFIEMNKAISTCRAGNVIGGGDFSANRIIPDCVKSAVKKEIISVRNPNSIRPYQHVLEADMFYLRLAMLQYEDKTLAGCYNIGPEECDCITTGEIVDIFCEKWNDKILWRAISINGPHEANFLKLDTAKSKSILGWKPIWNVNKAVSKTVEWSKAYFDKQDIEEITKKQIKEYLGGLDYGSERKR